MKSSFLKFITPTLVAGLALLSAGPAYAQPATSAPAPQPDFPRILLQPEDQLVHLDTNAVFDVKADNGPLTYQWLRNGKTLAGQTNRSLTVPKAQVSDVGFYSCNVIKDLEVVPTRAASLMIFTNYTPVETGIDPVIVWVLPTTINSTNTDCGIAYIGQALYTKTVAQGWGWKPDTNTTGHTATDTNRTNTKVFYLGKNGDKGCAQTSVTIPHPPVSTAYRFTIYFTNSVPTNPYAITLDGFLP